MFELEPALFARVNALTRDLDIHLSIQSILDGKTPAKIYVDDAQHPRAAFIHTEHRFFVCGDAQLQPFGADLRRLFAECIYPQALAAGKREFIIYHAPGWETAVDAILADRDPIHAMREYYACVPQPRPLEDLPEGFSLLPVNQALLDTPGLVGLDDLAEELCSERASVTDFLANSFGVCLTHANELAGWCLSEYNSASRCEIGIETREAFRRRGLGALITAALVDQALARGVTQVGWHCWKSNVASGATALHAGFEKVCEYPVVFAWFDRAMNLAIHGNICFSNQAYAQALDWFEKAFAAGQPEAWVSWVAACAAARLEQFPEAMRYLAQAMQRGFVHLDVIQNAPELRPLHPTDGWKKLIQRYG